MAKKKSAADGANGGTAVEDAPEGQAPNAPAPNAPAPNAPAPNAQAPNTAPDEAGDAELNRAMLRSMLLQRRFEERCAEAYAIGKIGGFCHLYIGQEAVSTGSMSVLRPDDYVITTYRDHGQALARGISARGVMAELFGRADGVSGGKGGSMHIFDARTNFLGGHGIVGGHVPIGTGVAFAIKYRGGDQVCVCFMGESVVNTGAFHEALNMAGLWKLPCVYVIENNRYGMGTALERGAHAVAVHGPLDERRRERHLPQQGGARRVPQARPDHPPALAHAGAGADGRRGRAGAGRRGQGRGAGRLGLRRREPRARPLRALPRRAGRHHLLS